MHVYSTYIPKYLGIDYFAHYTVHYNIIVSWIHLSIALGTYACQPPNSWFMTRKSPIIWGSGWDTEEDEEALEGLL